MCPTLRLNLIVPFNIFKFSSDKKLEGEKRKVHYKTFLELYIFLGFL